MFHLCPVVCPPPVFMYHCQCNHLVYLFCLSSVFPMHTRVFFLGFFFVCSPTVSCVLFFHFTNVWSMSACRNISLPCCYHFRPLDIQIPSFLVNESKLIQLSLLPSRARVLHLGPEPPMAFYIVTF